MTAANILRSFERNSTTHGINVIFLSSGFFKKTFWICSTFVATVMLLTNLSIQIQKFFSYPITVGISIEHANDIDFPAVTLCNISPVKKSAFQVQSFTKRKKRSLNQFNAKCSCFCCSSYNGTNQANECIVCSIMNPSFIEYCKNEIIYQTTKIPLNFNQTMHPKPQNVQTTDKSTDYVIQTTSTPNAVPKEAFQNAELLTEYVSGLSSQDRQQLGFTINDLILNCSYAGSNCDPKYFLKFDNPIHGNCFIFNSGWQNQRLISHRTGRRYGLVMTLNINQDEYVLDAGDTAGIRLLVHSGLQMPFPEDQGVLVSPGHSTSISLQKVVIERIGNPYSECIDPVNANKSKISNVYTELFPETEYSQGACQRTCYQKNVIMSCGCGDPYYPLSGKVFMNYNWPVCSVTNKSQDQCRKKILNDYNNNVFTCYCPVLCRETSYVTSVSIGQWPSHVLLNETLKYLEEKVSFDIFGVNKYKNNLMTVEIYFEEFNFQVLSESPSYEVAQFLSDVGGILGLYLGMSFMSVIEFIELIIDLLMFLCYKCNFELNKEKKNVSAKQNDGNNFDKEIKDDIELHKVYNAANFENKRTRFEKKKIMDSVRDLLLKI